MEKKIARLFDYQKYAANKDLSDIIGDVESRYSLDSMELSDDDLSLVSAAGAFHAQAEEKGERKT